MRGFKQTLANVVTVVLQVAVLICFSFDVLRHTTILACLTPFAAFLYGMPIWWSIPAILVFWVLTSLFIGHAGRTRLGRVVTLGLYGWVGGNVLLLLSTNIPKLQFIGVFFFAACLVVGIFTRPHKRWVD